MGLLLSIYDLAWYSIMLNTLLAIRHAYRGLARRIETHADRRLSYLQTLYTAI